MNNAMSLKAKIRNLAKQKNIPAQVILQNYMFERFLIRLSQTEYKDKFILKGGMLVAAVVGLDNRATMDLDATLRNYPLAPHTIEKALNDIFSVRANDDVVFSFCSIEPIRDDDIYGGYRVAMEAVFDTIITPLSIDISTGDAVTPEPAEYSFSLIFEPEKSFEIYAYNIETVLAEKVETVLRRSVFNTRPRDFYDIYILCTTQQIDYDIFKKAFAATSAHRGSTEQISNPEIITDTIMHSKALQELWNNYRARFAYAADIEYETIICKLRDLLK